MERAADFREKLTSIGFSRSSHRQPKKTVDELGNVTTEHWNDRQDVTIRAPRVVMQARQEEER